MNKLEETVLSIVNRTADSTLLHNNANKASERIPVLRDFIAGEVCKEIGLKMIPKDVADAHVRGDIHWHDLDYSPLMPQFNCMLIHLEEMLTNGFKMGNASIGTPNGIGTATAVTAQIIAQVASHIYGGNTINGIDEILAPYVKKTHQKNVEKIREIVRDVKANPTSTEIDASAWKLTVKDTYDAFQALEYEINTLHTANGQSPFCTLGFGLGEGRYARLIQESILKVRMGGLGESKRTAIFPKLVFALKKGVNRNSHDPNYDIKKLAIKCATERMYPDIINYENLVKNTGSFKYPMGCRSFLGPYEVDDELVHDGRNNLGVISINLPRIAIESGGDWDKFYSLLDERMGLVYDGLMCRIKRFDGVKAEVAPILYCEGAIGVRLKPEDDVSQIFKNGFSSISMGYIGIHEMMKIMTPEGEHIYHDKIKQQLAEGVLQYMRESTDQWKKETGYGFSLYSTPSESLCDRFCRMDKERFGEVGGITEKGYYTNSFHLDVTKKVSPDGKMAFEAPYAAIATGGFIVYAECPSMIGQDAAMEWLWDTMHDLGIGYGGFNSPIDRCGKCGWFGEALATENGFSCRDCGNHDGDTLQVNRRVCGYLGSPDSRPFIAGKQAEVQERTKHLRGI